MTDELVDDEPIEHKQHIIVEFLGGYPHLTFRKTLNDVVGFRDSQGIPPPNR